LGYAECPTASARAKIYFANGVLDDITQAISGREELGILVPPALPSNIKSDCLTYGLAFNSTSSTTTQPTLHMVFSGFLDLVETSILRLADQGAIFWQSVSEHFPGPSWLKEDVLTFVAEATAAFAEVLTGDLDSQVTSYANALAANDKIIIVAHSEGNLFANIAYNVLRSRGVAEGRLAVVAVATPEAFVPGNGPWTTLSEDIVIGYLALALPGRFPLAPNISNNLGNCVFLCHSFVDVYMVAHSHSSDKILEDIVDSLAITPTGAIYVQASLDGTLWSGGARYVVSGPAGDTQGSVVPVEAKTQPSGNYSVAYMDGGPPGTSFVGVSPSATQTLSAGGSLQFTLLFHAQALPPPLDQRPIAHFLMKTTAATLTENEVLSVAAESTTGEAPVTFVDISTDPDGDPITSRFWTVDTPCVPNGSAPCVLSDGLTSFTWGFKPGAYNVTLQVTDSRGGVGTATAHIEVAAPNLDPLAGTPVSLAFDGSSDQRFANTTLGDLFSDSHGNLVTLKFGPYGSTCGGNFCSPFNLVSISPFGHLKWEATEGDQPGTGWLGDDVNAGHGLAIGVDDRVFVETSRDHIREYQNGGALGGWPFVLGADDTHFTSLVAHPTTGDVFASAASSFTNGTPPSAAAISSSGTLRLSLDDNAGLWYLGEGGDPYLVSGHSITRFRADTMAPVCSGTFGGFVAFGSPAGLIGGRDADLSRFGGDCQEVAIASLSASSVGVSALGGGRVFGHEYTGSIVQPYDSHFDRLVGIRVADGGIWRQSDIAPVTSPDGLRWMVYQQGTLYAIGLDKTDSFKQKLFFLDATTGEILGRLETQGLCEQCRLTATTDGRVYLNDWSSTKIFKLPLATSVSAQLSVSLSNVDDVERLRLNGVEVVTVGYQQSQTFDLTGQLAPGANLIEIEVENLSGGWNFGYDLKADGTSVYASSCGQVGASGCNGNDQTAGVVFREKFIVVKR
jgi:hypothetical protein